MRGVRTEIIRELVQAGESQDAIAEVYELPRESVEAAVRYELLRARSPGPWFYVIYERNIAELEIPTQR